MSQRVKTALVQRGAQKRPKCQKGYNRTCSKLPQHRVRLQTALSQLGDAAKGIRGTCVGAEEEEQPSALKMLYQWTPFDQRFVLHGGQKLNLNKLLMANWDAQHTLLCREETDFGQSRFGHPDLTNLGQSNFGQSNWAQTQKNRAPKGGAPKGLGPKISRFFSVSPPVSLFFSLIVCLLVVFWWCLKRRSPQMCVELRAVV